jgi:exopolysaccharide biosynthesis polyprenyl glycosylphosphotransferase
VLESTAAELAPTARVASTPIATTPRPLESFSAEPAAPASDVRRGELVARALLIADATAIFGAVAIAFVVAHATATPPATAAALLASVVVLTVGARARGLYGRDEQRPEHSTLDEIGALFQVATASAWAVVLLMWVVSGRVALAPVVGLWAASVLFLVLGRTAARTAVRRSPAYLQNTLIVGAGEVGQLVARKLFQHPEFGLRVVGFADATPRELRTGLEGVPVIGAPSDVEALVKAHDVDRVIVAFSSERHDVLLPLVRALRRLDVHVDFVPRLFEVVGPLSFVHLIEGFPLLSVRAARASRLARRTKRVIDVVLGSTILAVSLPLFAWIALRIKRDSPGPVFFRQTRLGEGQRPFTLLEFRTMRVDTDAAPHREYVRGIMDVAAPPAANNLYKLDRTDAVTRVGAWLRRLSLDELPQLINVVRGEMSLVGPRPCIGYETELFEPHHFDRFLVPAGMTGLWQVAARARATFKEALDLDAAYARSWSLGLDAALLLRTPSALLRDRTTT